MADTCCHHQTCLPSLAMQFVFPWSDLLVMDLHRRHAPSSVQAALYSIQISCITGQLQSGHCVRGFPSKSHVLSVLHPFGNMAIHERRTTSTLLSERPECLTMRLTPHNSRHELPSLGMQFVFPWSDLLVMDLHRPHAATSVQAALYSIQITCITGQLQ